MSGRGKRKDDDNRASDGDSDGNAPPRKSAKQDDDEDGIVVCEISKNRRVSVRSWQGRVVVDIREFYVKDGKQMPGRKGTLFGLIAICKPLKLLLNFRRVLIKVSHSPWIRTQEEDDVMVIKTTKGPPIKFYSNSAPDFILGMMIQMSSGHFAESLPNPPCPSKTSPPMRLSTEGNQPQQMPVKRQIIRRYEDQHQTRLEHSITFRANGDVEVFFPELLIDFNISIRPYSHAKTFI
ncbi:hypothetical protein Cgig2_022903 [Carnegiea gigantea]|uniref:Transcriptional coactivator p15 (PC4) C-terminal domain-containing protein n=1 Tax=Carnegiea gigantea TaxID=171969 RepID=A0A9Q1KQN4_9CARY|nr:hypothetical protein Cgig2_022903 [Carnegiea gigantea]